MTKNLDLTIIIKTFERPHAVKRLYHSIQLFYPDLPIIIADDSKIPLQNLGKSIIIQLPYNVGLSKGRNELVKAVTTKYLLLLDDDFFFTKQTNLHIPYDILEDTHFDIVGIELKDFGWKNRINRGVYSLENNILWLHQLQHHNLHHGLPEYDFILNCFMARTDVIKENLWDEAIKLGHEHDDFFLTLKEKNIKITHTNLSIMEHYPDMIGKYKNIREDTEQYKQLFFKKRNLVKVSQTGRNYPYWQRKTDTLLKHLKLLRPLNETIYKRHLKRNGLNYKNYH